MTEITLFISALTIGLLGSVHCIGMCGGITSALSMSISGKTKSAVFGLMLCYHLGRILSYALAGFILGSVGWFLGDSSPVLRFLLRILAGFMLVFMGLYVSGIWKGLTRLEVIGGVLWRKLQPIGKHLIPVKTVTGALSLGGLWGWLPCGLVYSTLVWSSSQGSPLQSALLMFCFGVGTIPSVLLTGLLSKQLHHIIQAQLTRNIAGIMMILFGLWTFPGPHQKAMMGLISF
ncbi:MAG: sulfite exporter TauE/SafE family protein [Candidatus Endonucleobacter bathymodioli]|uniref:Sulfite exporter TauE/SafE family protein n=1 Tax=Candidatus Endonucleibacter bathymodioli TaxID=539814 RepID=A0AA90SCS9_9GAMM|nr:sulfite exporter TauE/SafE family protein [Candidatus Endonucleobacter bathymodioli]